jgi:hypothetical protein
MAGTAQPDLALLELKTQAFNSWSPQQTWFAWCSTTGTTITMGDSAWSAWNSTVATTGGSLAFNYTTNTAWVSTGQQWLSWNAAHQAETEEQQAARVAREAEVTADWKRHLAEQNAREAERVRETAAADRRAQELLLSLLSPEQRESYLDRGWFEVRGSRGGRWRIRDRGQSGNVDLMPEIGEERDATYCAHPPGGLPAADAHLAQMLALVTDEESFVRIANVHYRRPGGHVPPFMQVPEIA